MLRVVVSRLVSVVVFAALVVEVTCDPKERLVGESVGRAAHRPWENRTLTATTYTLLGSLVICNRLSR